MPGYPLDAMSTRALTMSARRDAEWPTEGDVAMTQPTTTPAAQPADPTTTTTTQPTGTPATTATATTTPDPADKPLGESGLRALQAERDARAALEKKLADLEKANTDKFAAIAAALGVAPTDPAKSDADKLAEQVAQIQAQLATSEAARMRAEVAAAKGLPPALAARLQGSTADELAADADALLALMPAGTAKAAGATVGGPAPDPSQGARGGSDQLTALLTEAQKAGNVAESIRLKNAIAAQRAPR